MYYASIRPLFLSKRQVIIKPWREKDRCNNQSFAAGFDMIWSEIRYDQRIAAEHKVR
jgi:hypothetical protein